MWIFSPRTSRTHCRLQWSVVSCTSQPVGILHILCELFVMVFCIRMHIYYYICCKWGSASRIIVNVFGTEHERTNCTFMCEWNGCCVFVTRTRNRRISFWSVCVWGCAAVYPDISVMLNVYKRLRSTALAWPMLTTVAVNANMCLRWNAIDWAAFGHHAVSVVL